MAKLKTLDRIVEAQPPAASPKELRERNEKGRRIANSRLHADRDEK